MKLKQYLAQHFAAAIKHLLAPGAAWDWPVGGFGHSLLLASAQELARIYAWIQPVFDRAIETHRPKYASWHISEYRRIANESLGGLVETMPRRMAAIGSHVGDRLWSANGPATTFEVPLVQVDHLFGPAKIGSHIGDGLWGHRSRYILRVRYYRSVVNPQLVWDALMDFKQAHVFLWFEDITGSGGVFKLAQE